jgi:hypothetical protein
MIEGVQDRRHRDEDGTFPADTRSPPPETASEDVLGQRRHEGRESGHRERGRGQRGKVDRATRGPDKYAKAQAHRQRGQVRQARQQQPAGKQGQPARTGQCVGIVAAIPKPASQRPCNQHAGHNQCGLHRETVQYIGTESCGRLVKHEQDHEHHDATQWCLHVEAPAVGPNRADGRHDMCPAPDSSGRIQSKRSSRV